MTRVTVKYYFKIICKGCKNNSVGSVNFALILFAGLFTFLLLGYEPANEWHDTTFTLSHYEYRHTRGGGVVELYTTDNRCYVLNHNEEIGYLLEKGQQYNAVYSDDFFHDIIKGLKDTDYEYINTVEMRKIYETERAWFRAILILCIFLLLIINFICAISCIKEEKKRVQQRFEKRE